MIDIYLYKKPAAYIRAYLDSLSGSEKRGAHQTLAEALRIFPSYLSLILKEERQLNLDQGVLLSDFLKLKKTERRYLYRMIELARAQNSELKKEIETEMREMAVKENQIGSRVEKEKSGLTLEESVHFFSSWKFSAVHLFAAINDQLNPQLVSRKLNIELNEAREVIVFLLKTGLWKKKAKSVEIGPAFIHLDHHSALLNHHHTNWRIKATDLHTKMEKEKELAYSLCVALSREDALKIRSILINAVSDIRKVADPSESQVLYNLNIDWLNLTRES